MGIILPESDLAIKSLENLCASCDAHVAPGALPK